MSEMKPSAPTPDEMERLAVQMRKRGDEAAAFSQRMQDARTAEYVAKGDTDAHYVGMKPEQTFEYEVANALDSAAREIRGKDRELNGGCYICGKTPCLASVNVAPDAASGGMMKPVCEEHAPRLSLALPSSPQQEGTP